MPRKAIMLQSCLVDPFCGSDALLVVARKLLQNRMAAFAAIVRRLDEDRAGDADRDKLRRQADELRTEWQAIAQAVAATPAARLSGLQAKAGVLRCYFEHVGGAEGIDIDLARSLAADLNDKGGE